MNLEQAIASSELRRRVGHNTEDRQEKHSLEIAKRVFEVSAMANEPYVNMKPEEWAQRWLTSQTFVLAEIAPHHVAVPNVNRINKNKVQATLHASAEEIEPIVVDLNKNGIGATNSGYIPKVIVVDGKHRHRAQSLRGKDRILAWVGELAMAELQKKNTPKQFVVKAAAKQLSSFPATKLDSLAQMYAAVAGPAQGMVRQDVGDGGSRPTGGTKMAATGGAGGMGGLGGGSGMNPARKGIFGQNARSSGSFIDEDPSDKDVPPDPSDRNKTFPDPSDRAGWDAKKPQDKAPGADYKPFKWVGQGPSQGSGVGPRVKAYGTSEGVKKEWDTRGRKTEMTDGQRDFLNKFMQQHQSSDFEKKANQQSWIGPGLDAKRRKMEAGPIKVKKIVTSPKGKK